MMPRRNMGRDAKCRWAMAPRLSVSLANDPANLSARNLASRTCWAQSNLRKTIAENLDKDSTTF
jgi:hypothetical protein